MHIGTCDICEAQETYVSRVDVAGMETFVCDACRGVELDFDPTKPCSTRCGRSVEILTVLPPEKAAVLGQRIVALITDDEGERSIETYTMDGRYLKGRGSVWDLVNTGDAS